MLTLIPGNKALLVILLAAGFIGGWRCIKTKQKEYERYSVYAEKLNMEIQARNREQIN